MEWIIFIFIMALFVCVMDSGNSKKIENIVQEHNDNWIIANGINVTSSHKINTQSGNFEYCVDEEKKKIIFFTDVRKNPIVINFSDILGCEIMTNGKVTDGVKRAIVGGVIGGGFGAVIGSVTATEKITNYDFMVYINRIGNSVLLMSLVMPSNALKPISNEFQEIRKFSMNLKGTIKAIVERN